MQRRDGRARALVLVAVLLGAVAAAQLRAQGQPFVLQGRQYVWQDGKWYTFFEGRVGDEIIPRRLVVHVRDGGYRDGRSLRGLGVEGVFLASARFLDGCYVLGVAPEVDPFAVAKVLESSVLFEEVSFDAYGTWHVTPSDPLFPQQWNLQQDKLAMASAWDICTGSSQVIVGIVDSGTMYTHEDLDGNIWVNPAEDRNGNGIPEFFPVEEGGDLDGVDNDGKSKVDDLVGWDFWGDDPEAPTEEDNDPGDPDGHGTSVSGICAAQTNNYEGGAYRGIAGVAGGWGNTKGARLMIVRAGSWPTESLVAQAIEYAHSNGARVINISGGFLEDHEALRRAVLHAANAGVVVVASTGNANKKDTIDYPARYSNTIAVGGTDQNDNRWV